MDKKIFDYYWSAYEKGDKLCNGKPSAPRPLNQGQPLPRVQAVPFSFFLGGDIVGGALGEDGTYYINHTEAINFHSEDDWMFWFSYIWRWKDDSFMCRVPTNGENSGVMICITVERFLQNLMLFYGQKDCPKFIKTFVEDVQLKGCDIPRIQQMIDDICLIEEG
jgi:hypothetical protein